MVLFTSSACPWAPGATRYGPGAHKCFRTYDLPSRNKQNNGETRLSVKDKKREREEIYTYVFLSLSA